MTLPRKVIFVERGGKDFQIILDPAKDHGLAYPPGGKHYYVHIANNGERHYYYLGYEKIDDEMYYEIKPLKKEIVLSAVAEADPKHHTIFYKRNYARKNL